jgi:TolB-like protein
MTSLPSCSNKFKLLLILILCLLLSPTLADTEEIRKGIPVTKGEKIRIAVFPLENLSGVVAPVREIREIFIEKLRAKGVNVLDEEALEKFMAKYRIRYAGGIEGEIAKAFQQEVGIGGVLMTSLEFYSDANPPKISLISRLVSTGDNPSILWMDGVGLAGDDSRGLLDLGLIEDPRILLNKAMKMMFDSLDKYLTTRAEGKETEGAKRKFRPNISYRSPAFDPERKYTVAIAPFVNLSGRKYAGEIMVLHLARELKRFATFNVIELGLVRQAFLELRIILDQGISLNNADSVLSLLNADLILSGDVTEYEDYQGVWGKPKVSFSAQLIEKKSREVVWSSYSYNEGDDGVFFFDWGRVNTASVMASQMARWIGKRMTMEEEGEMSPLKKASGPVETKRMD